ncbi:hypothetical protein [Tessaracoccus aquimaris]|uniref:hypothetical protein n=1 Tax=Tessaracoccus aquimaris TaxID=1332264 RepID=UPI001D04470F|nr:hypothetical protein [Tessaracoccus aquimaris]
MEAAYHDNFGEFETADNVNGVFRFATFMANLRQRHDALLQNHWGDLIADDQDVSYLFRTPSGEGSTRGGDRTVGVYINSPGDNFFVMINMADVSVQFTAPEISKGRFWRALINTDVSEESHANYWAEGEGPVQEGSAQVPAWSVVVWQERAQA